MWWNSDKYRIWGHPHLCNPPVSEDTPFGRGPPLEKGRLLGISLSLKSIPISFDVAEFSMNFCITKLMIPLPISKFFPQKNHTPPPKNNYRYDATEENPWGNWNNSRNRHRRCQMMRNTMQASLRARTRSLVIAMRTQCEPRRGSVMVSTFFSQS